MSLLKVPNPTDMELSILRILWSRGPCKVRAVAEALTEEKGEKVGYTSALKHLQIMYQKELVWRDESERSHVYSARHNQEQMEQTVLQRLADKLFGGAMGAVAVHALSADSISAAELEEVKALIRAKENKLRTNS